MASAIALGGCRSSSDGSDSIPDIDGGADAGQDSDTWPAFDTDEWPSDDTDTWPGPDTDTEIPRPPDDTTGCLIIFSFRNHMSEDGFSKVYVKRTYDPQTRTITDARSSSPEFEPGTVQLNYTRLDANGRPEIVAEKDAPHTQPYRKYFERDAFNNVTGFKSYVGSFDDLSDEPTGNPVSSKSFQHQYDGLGQLTRTDRVASGDGTLLYQKYTHDDQGRCHSMVAELGEPFNARRLELRRYAGNRVSQRWVHWAYADFNRPFHALVMYNYDLQGRVTALQQDGGGHWPMNPSGFPSIQAFLTYDSNGARLYEYRDFTTDVPIDSIEFNGATIKIDRRFNARSPGCEAIEQQIPRAQILQCEFQADIIPEYDEF